MLKDKIDIWCGCPPWQDNNFQMETAIKRWGLRNNYKWIDQHYYNGTFTGEGFVEGDMLLPLPIKLDEFYLIHKKEIWEDYKSRHPHAKFFGDTEFDDLLDLEYSLFNECNNLLEHFNKLPDLDVSNKDNFKHHIEELKKLILMRAVIREYKNIQE